MTTTVHSDRRRTYTYEALLRRSADRSHPQRIHVR